MDQSSAPMPQLTPPSAPDESMVIAVSRQEWDTLTKQVADMHRYIADLHVMAQSKILPAIDAISKNPILGRLIPKG